LRQRVNEYFQDRNLSEKANGLMYLKTLSMLALYFVPYTLLYLLGASPIWIMAMYFVMGFGMSGIGMSVMHDAIHGAYHSNKWVNKIMGATIYFISGNAATWRVQHNVLHHNFTNVEGLDDDMKTAGLLRLHRSQDWKPIHKYQAWYAPFVYSLLTINWVISKDFRQLMLYYKEGMEGHNTHNIRNEWIILIATKMMYLSLFLVLPMIFTEAAWYWTLMGFLLMHFTAGFVLSYVFQLAHMVEDVEHEDIPADGNMDEWMEHQLKTTANFAPKNWLLNWYVGGLNFQIEHHLFPNICHIHYPQIAKIERQTTEEFHLNYQQHDTLMGAVRSHYKHLRLMADSKSTN
jgi:linoleoyl-CoA desaturase